jgi:cobalt/nickel transport system permease protein
MAFYGCMLGGGVVWPLVIGRSPSRLKVFAASIIGNVAALQLGAFSVALQTLASGVTELPFGAFVAVMQPIHALIGVIEGVITGSVLCFILDSRPEMLQLVSMRSSARLSRASILGVLAAASFVIGALLSLAASGRPDGLEWSIERVAGTSELERGGMVHSGAAKVQEQVSLLPDYALADSESAGGNILSGVVGTGLVLVLCLAGAFLIKRNSRSAS